LARRQVDIRMLAQIVMERGRAAFGGADDEKRREHGREMTIERTAVVVLPSRCPSTPRPPGRADAIPLLFGSPSPSGRRGNRGSRRLSIAGVPRRADRG